MNKKPEHYITRCDNCNKQITITENVDGECKHCGCEYNWFINWNYERSKGCLDLNFYKPEDYDVETDETEED